MVKSAVSPAEKITAEEFAAYLGKYPACIEAISKSKGARAGQKTLAELDQYRYGEAVDTFGSTKSKSSSMGIDEVKLLVEWKLRHGKFRPTLMNLVGSNPPSNVKKTAQEAIALYREEADEKSPTKPPAAMMTAITTLSKLKGIGPATASLLLAVHDPEDVIFFADEAFYWLCCGGAKSPIKYNNKEYADLSSKARALSKRLGVKAVDIERVAFVLMRQQEGEDSVSATTAAGPARTTTTSAKEERKQEKMKGKAKRKQPPSSTDNDDDNDSDDDIKQEVPVRRSKRGKKA